MSQNNTDIKLKRSRNTLSELEDHGLLFGEPFFIDNTNHNDLDGSLIDPVEAYLVLGRKPDENEETVSVKNSPIIKALSLDKANKMVFYNSENGSITNESGEELPVNRLTVKSINKEDISVSDTTKYYILCQSNKVEDNKEDNTIYKFSLEDLGIFIGGNGVMKGAAWNDYAETRYSEDEVVPGQVVCDTGVGSVALSIARLQPCAHVVSDTYGHVIGSDEENYIPIAVAGRALVAMDSSKLDIEVGDCVCAGPNGLASKMTRQEIINYPDRILGVVCEIPDYLSIDKIYVDDRIWINIK